MRFSVRPLRIDRTPFGNYEYEILDGDRVVARYWHDYRGDEHAIEFLDGRSEHWPVGTMLSVLTNDAELRVVLTDAAVAYLTRMVGSTP